MAALFNLPQMGQTMTEATILRWLRQEGDAVQDWEGIVEMMTDKINMEVEPRISGTLRKILAAEGTVVPVGAPIAIIGAPDEDISGLLAELSARPAPDGRSEIAPGAAAGGETAAPPAGFPGLTNGEIPSVSPRAREAAAEAGLDWHTVETPGTGYEGMVVERDVLAYLARGAETARATPLAAKIAADLGVDPGDLSGTGPAGRVRADDVRRAAERRRAPAIAAREIPLQGMRRVIAGRLAASYQQAVHVPLRVDVDMSAASELRRQLKPAIAALGGRLTFTDLIAGAAAQALAAHPELNATLESDVIRIHPTVNLGIAVALDEGLTVPVIRDAHAMRLPELSAAIAGAAAGARAGKLSPDAYSGGTFTITNLGPFGVDSFDPILNPPQVGILGVGQMRERVVPVDGAPAVRPVLTLTLTFDHRALDGAPAARFLAAIRELLENPARLLL